MDELVRAYIDFINDYNPYWECYEDPKEVIEIEIPEMLYNLEEIRKDFDPEETDKDLLELRNKLDNVIRQFKAAGIKTIRRTNNASNIFD